MDIQYLLFLQDFRNSIDNALTPFMEGVSMFAVTYLILFPVYYYWNRNKRDGLYALVAYYFCMVITPLVKLTACVYRPWIRDSRIVPAGKAIVTATGYSFPSGHTTTAAPLAGFVFCCLALVYITLKPYPMDYTAGGKLLVDPQKMMNDGYGDTGKMMGFNYIALFPVVLKIFDKRG